MAKLGREISTTTVKLDGNGRGGTVYIADIIMISLLGWPLCWVGSMPIGARGSGL